MSKKILLTIVIVCIAQLAYCRVGRQHAPPAPTTTASPLNAALNMLNDTLDSVHQSFLTIAGVKSDEEFFAKARGHIDTLQNTITSTVNDLNEETKPLQGQAQDLVKAFAAKISDAGNELKARHPELFSGDTKKLQEYGEKTVKTVLEESKKLRDKLQAEGTKITPQLEAALKNVYDSAVKTANDLKVQAENAINTAKKSLF